MNRKEFDKTERRDVSRKAVQDALENVLLAPQGKARGDKAKRDARYRLDRKPRR